MAAAGLPVKCEFTNKFNVPYELDKNLYSDHCRKGDFPDQVQVITKDNLLKAINLALKKGADVGQNAAISKLCVTKKTSELNVDNLCCISHRWTTTDMKIDEFVKEFKQFLRSGMFVGTDVCFDDKNYQDAFVAWHDIVRDIIRSRFDNDEAAAKTFLEFLVNNVTPRGLLAQPKEVKSSKPQDDEDADVEIDLSAIQTQEMMWMGPRGDNCENIIMGGMYNQTIEKIVKLFLYISPPEFLPQISKATRDKTIASFKGKITGKSNLELVQSIQNILKQASESLLDVTGKKLKEQAEGLMKGLNHITKIPGRSEKFNGYDPIALAVLLLAKDSGFDYFWVDVFCAPQGHASMEETLQAVKNGMAVFSLATVLIVPPFDTKNWVAMRETLLRDVLQRYDMAADFYKKLPTLTFADKGLLFCEDSYFERLWTLHEMAIGGRLIHWTQFLFGPFSKLEKDKKIFSVDLMPNERFKVTLVPDAFSSGMARSNTVNLLRSYGPGDSLSIMFQTNYDCMQTSFSLDWDALATSIFALQSGQPVSDQLLYKKFSNYASFLLQYSPTGAKYSYAWAVRPEDVNHTFKFDKNNKLVAGVLENPPASTKPAKFSLKGGKATLNGKPLLHGCIAYKINQVSKAVFEALQLHTLYGNIGLRKKDFEDCSTPGYLITGKWKVPESVRKIRDERIKVYKQHAPPSQDQSQKDSMNMMLDYLKGDQDVVIIKSSDPKNDFTLVYNAIPHTIKGLPDAIKADQAYQKLSGATKIESLDINMI